MDFQFINSRLATGASIEHQEDLEVLISAGITHVIDCRDGIYDTMFLAKSSKISYLQNPIADDGEVKPPEWFKRSLDFALRAFVEPRSKVYAHCAVGMNRGPSTAYCIMRAVGYTKDYARHLIHVARPITIAGIIYADDADFALLHYGYEKTCKYMI